MIGDRSGTVPPSVTTPSLGSTASLYPECVELPVPLQRLAFRCAFVVLFVYRFIVRPSLHGVKCVLTSSGTVLLVRHTYGPKRWELPVARRGYTEGLVFHHSVLLGTKKDMDAIVEAFAKVKKAASELPR